MLLNIYPSWVGHCIYPSTGLWGTTSSQGPREVSWCCGISRAADVAEVQRCKGVHRMFLGGKSELLVFLGTEAAGGKSEASFRHCWQVPAEGGRGPKVASWLWCSLSTSSPELQHKGDGSFSTLQGLPLSTAMTSLLPPFFQVWISPGSSPAYMNVWRVDSMEAEWSIWQWLLCCSPCIFSWNSTKLSCSLSSLLRLEVQKTGIWSLRTTSRSSSRVNKTWKETGREMKGMHSHSHSKSPLSL